MSPRAHLLIVRLFGIGLLLAVNSSVASNDKPSPSSELTSLPYRSVLKNYQQYREPVIESWPAANDRVGKMGGWRTYAKQAAAERSESMTSQNTQSHQQHDKGDEQ